MSEIPIVIVAYYFAFFGFVFEHALLFASIAVVLWLLLLVPIKVWTKLWSMIHRPIGHATRRHSPVRELPRPEALKVPVGMNHRPLDHAR
ncbi:hypothetical protein JGU71_20795 [Antrihabitans sp. YC3-6]|uniref:Uncharacterized protein n=1 Tax=Antrihabitans stalagmiti TaxID=2799499 RepID=A0A934U5G4_9NOCA|nr:hypothetical protein [Antrihabitans stalagmiti]MBJ8341327.1 hypothetical protein [Antrihabitans stalagmiti]